MLMEEYRISKSRDEIVKCLEKKFESSGLFTVWQKNKNNEREFVIEATLQDFNKNEGFFSLLITDEKFSKADKNGEFYFLLQGHEFVFKSKMTVDQIKGECRFQIPKEVRLKELRIYPRKYFQQEDKVSVDVVFKSKPKTNQEKERVESQFPILNVSMGGVCIVVSKETLSSIDLSKEIEISGLSFYESLQSDMKAVVRNARVYIKKSFSNDEYYALGLEFNHHCQ